MDINKGPTFLKPDMYSSSISDTECVSFYLQLIKTAHFFIWHSVDSKKKDKLDNVTSSFNCGFSDTPKQLVQFAVWNETEL